MGLYEYLTDRDINADAALVDNQTPFLLMGGISTGQKALGYAPYINDIWQGRKLLFHKPFEKMTREEFKNYGKLGKEYYKNHLQRNPINIKGYGNIIFGGTNKGKDNTRNMEQYPFLRKNLQSAKWQYNSNDKQEIDRTYDHFFNTHNNNLYDYLIENITKDGKRYKMMKNKALGE